MNYVDFTILLIAVIGFLYGLIKGVIRQVGSLGGFIAGIVVARFFGSSFSALLREMFDLPEGVSRVIAYSLLFLIFNECEYHSYNRNIHIQCWQG